MVSSWWRIEGLGWQCWLKRCSSCEHQLANPQKIQHKIAAQPSNSTSGPVPGSVSRNSDRHWYPVFTAAPLTTGERWKRPSVHRQIRGQTRWDIYAMSYYLASEKGGNSDMCYNMDEPWKRASYKRTHIIWSYFCEIKSTSTSGQMCRDRKRNGGGQELRGRGHGESL